MQCRGGQKPDGSKEAYKKNIISKHLQHTHSETQHDNESLVSGYWIGMWKGNPLLCVQIGHRQFSQGNFSISAVKQVLVTVEDLDMMVDKVPIWLVGSQTLEAFDWWLMLNSHWAHYDKCKCLEKRV